MSAIQIASNIRQAVAELLAGAAPAGAAQAMSAQYRRQAGHAVHLSDAGKHAYLAARMPATFAAASQALSRLADAGGPDIETLLDAGCGPGTASLAAAEYCPSLNSVTRSDLDGTWRPIAEMLGAASGHPALSSARWLTGAMDTIAYRPHDAVMAVYALNEVPAARRREAVRRLWAASSKALIIVEPGTPQGFMNIRDARSVALELGAQIAAPCTHHGECPMSETDWCHSAVRLARDSLHRTAKGGQLPFEDEKFALLAVTRAAVSARPSQRIVKRPVAHSGHMTLDLCGPDGLTRRTVSRRDGVLYKAARKADWGDSWPD